MIRALLLTAGLFVATHASAVTPMEIAVGTSQKVLAGVVAQGFNFVKGDSANYKLNMGGFINGTMAMLVADVGADGVWIHQDMDLGFMGKQNIQELIDPNTGEIKKMIVNGKEQAPPEAGDIEVIDSKEDTITVPAGTYTCLYIKAKVTQQGQTSNMEQWIDLRDIPVMGLVKTTMDSQMGPVTIELTSFKRN